MRALLLVVIAGCSSGGAPAKPPPPPPVIDAGIARAPDAAAAMTCEARVAAFRVAMAPWPLEDRVPHPVTPPTSPTWQPAERAGVVATLDAQGELGDWGEEDLRSEIEMRVEEDGVGRVLLYVFADAKAPVRAVTALLGTMPDHVVPRLVVMRDVLDRFDGVVVPAGAAAWVHEWFAQQRELDDLTPQALTDALKRSLGDQCPQMVEAYGEIGKADPSDREHLPAELFPDALAACACRGVDPGFEVIQALRGTNLWGWLPLERIPDGLGEQATVADLAAALAKR